MADSESRVTGLNGVVLIADDFDAQVMFYRDVLGLEVQAEAANAVFFRCGEQVFAVFARGHHAEGDRALGGARHGLSHLEFRLPADAEARMKKELEEAGAHAYRDVFRDPDGNLFHFVSD